MPEGRAPEGGAPGCQEEPWWQDAHPGSRARRSAESGRPRPPPQPVERSSEDDQKTGRAERGHHLEQDPDQDDRLREDLAEARTEQNPLGGLEQYEATHLEQDETAGSGDEERKGTERPDAVRPRGLCREPDEARHQSAERDRRHHSPVTVSAGSEEHLPAVSVRRGNEVGQDVSEDHTRHGHTAQPEP